MDAYTTILVSDNGIGIAPDDFKKLFDYSQAFTTTGTEKESGTCLGLPLCKGFVEKYGGEARNALTKGKACITNYNILNLNRTSLFGKFFCPNIEMEYRLQQQ